MDVWVRREREGRRDGGGGAVGGSVNFKLATIYHDLHLIHKFGGHTISFYLRLISNFKEFDQFEYVMNHNFFVILKKMRQKGSQLVIIHLPKQIQFWAT